MSLRIAPPDAKTLPRFTRRAAVCAVVWISLCGAVAVRAAEPITDFEDVPRLLAHLPLEPYAAALTPQRDRFVTGHNDGSLVVWRTADGVPLRRWNGHRDTVSGLAINVAGDRIASAAYDGTIGVWLSETGAAISSLPQQPARLTCVALSPEGTQVAAGGYDGLVRIWRDLAAPTLVVATTENTGTIRCLAFSPAGQLLAAGDDSGTVRLLNPGDASVLRTAKLDSEGVRSLAFAPDGSTLLIGSDLGRVQARSATTLEDAWGGQVLIPTHAAPLLRISFTDDGRLIATADQSGVVRIWKVATREWTSEFDNHQDEIAAVGFHQDAQALVTISRDRAVNLWKAKLPPTPRLARIDNPDGNLWAVAVAPDLSAVYAAGKKGFCGAWDLQTGKSARRCEGFKGTTDAIDLSPDGKHLAVCGWREQNTVIFDTQTGQKLAERTAEGKLRCVRFSPDGQLLAAGRDDGKVQTWNWQTDDGPRTASVSEQAVYDLAFSRDGARLAASGGDWRKPEPGFLKLLSVHDLAVTGELREHQHAVRGVMFHPDGKQLASTDEAGLVVIWNADTLLPVTRWKNAVGARPVAFAPDGTQLAVGLHDGSIQVWDSRSGELTHRFRSEDDVFALSFSSDGAVLFSASGKTGVEIWPLAAASSTIERIRGWVP
ncbi:MAG: WD40 repeat domain-containing protein [Planctomycetaceae bacterium]